MIYIGCSGWQYNHWKGVFYPDDVLKKEWLQFYASKFSTVEVNSTFYGAVKEKNFSDWYDQTPKKFIMSIKGTRYVTHLKKLRDVEAQVKDLYEQSQPLKDKIGCVLWQLPGALHKDLERLEGFCLMLDKRKKNVIEFRHASWFHQDVFDLLRKYKVGYCVVIAPSLPQVFEVTAPFAYIRFHGKQGWYTGSYSDEELTSFAAKIKSLKAKETYVYFNNDDKGYAPQNALTLQHILDAS